MIFGYTSVNIKREDLHLNFLKLIGAYILIFGLILLWLFIKGGFSF